MKRQDVIATYERLDMAALTLYDRHNAATKAEEKYTDTRMELLTTADPKTLGSNAEQREASLYTKCYPQLKALREAQSAERAARYGYEEARRELDRLHDLMRFTLPPVQRVASFEESLSEQPSPAEPEPPSDEAMQMFSEAIPF